MYSMKRTLGAWSLIMIAESLSGAFRRLVLVPAIGEMPSHRTGVAVGCVIVFAAAWFFTRCAGAGSGRRYFLVAGVVWVVLTVLFEAGLGLMLGYPAGRILADYDLSKGGLMGLALLFMLFAPLLASGFRENVRREP